MTAVRTLAVFAAAVVVVFAAGFLVGDAVGPFADGGEQRATDHSGDHR